jgi:hypothetical protein
MELCRKPVVVVTTSSFFGSACSVVAVNAVISSAGSSFIM